MDFILKRCGAHFCPPPIWAAKKACFLPPFQGFGHVAHMFFRFLLHRFCVFLHDFCIFSHFFVKFSACANANWQISGVICCVSDDHPMQISRIFPICTVEITQHTLCMVEIILYTLLYGWNYPAQPLYGWNYPIRPLYGWNYPARPLYGWNYPVHPSVWLRLPNTPFSMVEITQYTLQYGWNYPARPERAEALSPGQRPGYKAISNAPCKGKSFKYT